MDLVIIVAIGVLIVFALGGASSSSRDAASETDRAAIDEIKDRQADEYVHAWMAGKMTAADRDAAISKIRSVGVKAQGPARPER